MKWTNWLLIVELEFDGPVRTLTNVIRREKKTSFSCL